jgi:pimeloyl-ACP methyl ester carboxylesterase
MASDSLLHQLVRTRRFTLGVPDHFTVTPDGSAVAGAGVTDQLLYYAHWRERFLGHPAEFPQRYAACSLVRAASGLTRPLLLIHGLADSKVHPANTLRLSSALLAAGRPHEVLLLPGAGHQPVGTPVTGNLLRHQAYFLRRHLCAAGAALCAEDQRPLPRRRRESGAARP